MASSASALAFEFILTSRGISCDVADGYNFDGSTGLSVYFPLHTPYRMIIADYASLYFAVMSITFPQTAAKRDGRSWNYICLEFEYWQH